MRNKKILIAIITTIFVIIVGILIADKLINKKEKIDTPAIVEQNIDFSEATYIATEKFENAFYQISEGQNIINVLDSMVMENKENGEEEIYYKLEYERVRNYLSDRQIEKLKERAVKVGDNQYYISQNGLSFFKDTIFGARQEGMRKITVSSATHDTITATGSIYAEDGSINENEKTLKIVFIKSGENWVIDDYE